MKGGDIPEKQAEDIPEKLSRAMLAIALEAFSKI
jgi:hypothetical protein